MGEPMVTIQEWSVTTRDDSPYRAPEARRPCLAGRVFGHPGFPDGAGVVTSPILGTSGRVVRTLSREYVLTGPPGDGYAEWLRDRGYELDEEQPVKVAAGAG